MPSPFWLSAAVAILMAGLLVQSLLFHVTHHDSTATYKLFAVRDELIRLVILGKVERDEPHLDRLYRDLNALLRLSREVSGPGAWPRATAAGREMAHNPVGGKARLRMVMTEIPEPLRPAADQLRVALQHLLRNHRGVYLHIDAKRREAEKIRRARAKVLLDSMPAAMDHGASCA
jgi:hypothetical protein